MDTILPKNFYDSNCYREEVLFFPKSLWNNKLVTYLITLEGSNRRERYMKELHRVKPSMQVIILHNKGFKKCFKEGVYSPGQDLWHANQEIFRRCEADSRSVLILEDDVQFTSNIKHLQQSLLSFLNTKQNLIKIL